MHFQETLDFLSVGVAALRLSLLFDGVQGFKSNIDDIAEQAINEVAKVGAAVQVEYPHPIYVQALEGVETQEETGAGKASFVNIFQLF